MDEYQEYIYNNLYYKAPLLYFKHLLLYDDKNRVAKNKTLIHICLE